VLSRDNVRRKMPTLCLHAVKATLPRQGGSMVAVTTTEEHLDFFVTAVPKRWLLIKLGIIGLSRANSRPQCPRQNITGEVEPVPGILPRGAKCYETGSNGEKDKTPTTALRRRGTGILPWSSSRGSKQLSVDGSNTSLPRLAQQYSNINSYSNTVQQRYQMIPYSVKGEEEESFIC
jgi:hypothetical protein